jgi:hypothetical protein
MKTIEHNSPALTVNDVLENHIGDLQWRGQQDGGGEAGLDFVNLGTAGTPYFETEQELDQYLTDVAGLMK